MVKSVLPLFFGALLGAGVVFRYGVQQPGGETSLGAWPTSVPSASSNELSLETSDTEPIGTNISVPVGRSTDRFAGDPTQAVRVALAHSADRPNSDIRQSSLQACLAHYWRALAVKWRRQEAALFQNRIIGIPEAVLT